MMQTEYEGEEKKNYGVTSLALYTTTAWTIPLTCAYT